MKISALSLDSQLAILCQLPNHTLIGTIPLVCARWYRLQPHACLNRRQLILLISRRRPRSQPTGHLVLHPLPPLNATCTSVLTSTFPRLTNLRISQKFLDFEPLHQQLYLLERWATTLVHLELITDVDRQAAKQGQVSPQFTAFINRLLAILNYQMPHLKSLGLIILSQLPPTADLRPLLRRLIDFKLVCDNTDHQHIVWQLLQQQYTPTTSTLKHLALGTISHFPSFLPLLNCPSICSTLEGLRISATFDTTQLAITFDCCTNLRTLDLSLTTLKQYTERLHLLTKLPHLTNLTLRLKQYHLENAPLHLPAPLPVLPSIRQLVIYLPSTPLLPSHHYFNQITQLPQVFRQLHHIWLDWPQDAVSCQQCYFNRIHPSACIDALLRPLAEHLETLQKATVTMWMNHPSNYQIYTWMPRLRPLPS